jgi:predicted metalloprotease
VPHFLRLLLVIAVVWLLVLAWTTSIQGSTPAPTPPAVVVPTSQPTPRPPAPSVSTPYVPVLPQSIHTYPNLDAFIADAQSNVNDYWLHQPFRADRPYTAPRVTLMQPGVPVPCAAELKHWTSFYCPAERTIYLYQPNLDSGNTWAGYTAMYAILAHEWTHHVQFILGVPQVNPQMELQADCGSGMFLAAAWPHMAESDLEPLRRMLGSTPSDTTHRTPAERLAAFDSGYTNGSVDHCNLPLTYAATATTT